MKNFDLVEWFNDIGILDGLLARKMRDRDCDIKFPNNACLKAYRKGYRLGENVRSKKTKKENHRE